jgi:gluconokinase
MPPPGPGASNASAEPRALVVMGVSGCGKSTVGVAVAARLGWVFGEGDAFHSDENVKKMHAGRPLDDGDRLPWLRAIASWLDAEQDAGLSVVVTCSALKRSYRRLLAEGRPWLSFVFLDVDRDELERRLAARTGHFFPASMLDSQLRDLERPGTDEPVVTVRAATLGEAADAVIRSVTD